MTTTNNVYNDIGLNPIDPQTGTTRTPKKELGQEDFLKLLTTQLQNQDPMKPLDNSEFVAQMAQFSSVQSLQSLQSSFNNLATSMTSNQALQASALVGRYVLVKNDAPYLPASGGLEGVISLPEDAENVTVTIKDASGATVLSQNAGSLAEGDQPFGWDGKDADGNALPPGRYSVLVSGVVDGKTTTFDMQFYARVDSVNLGRNGDGVTLNLAGLGKVPLADVNQIG